MHNTQYNNSNNIIPIMNKPNSDIWIRQTKLDLNLGPETRLKARTKYSVYSCPSLPFLRIENMTKIKRHVFCSKNWILERKY